MAKKSIIESEIKLRMANPREAGLALARLGATLVRERYFEQNVLWDRHSSLATQGRILRLRWTGREGFLTLKGPRQVEDGIKSREELETSVADPDALAETLEILGFKPIFRYQKYRETYEWKDSEIVIDETPVGTFLEIEGPVETIHAAAAGLGFTKRDYLNQSYVELFLASGGQGDMVFR